MTDFCMGYTIYRLSDGAIMQTGACAPLSYEAQLLPWGDGYGILPEQATSARQHVRNGRVEERPATPEECMAALRVTRDRLLAACDWTQVEDAPVDRAAWQAYRQALRDLPDATDDPSNPVWPTPPA